MILMNQMRSLSGFMLHLGVKTHFEEAESHVAQYPKKVIWILHL